MNIIFNEDMGKMDCVDRPVLTEMPRMSEEEYKNFINANKYFINAFDEIYSDRNSDVFDIDSAVYPIINTYFKRKPKKQDLIHPIRQYDFDSYILKINIICKHTPVSITKEIKDKKEYLVDMKDLGELKHIVINNRYDIYYKHYIQRKRYDMYNFWAIISKLANRFSNKLVIMKDRKTNKEKRFMFNFLTIGGYPNLVYPDRIQKDDLEICKKSLNRII